MVGALHAATRAANGSGEGRCAPLSGHGDSDKGQQKNQHRTGQWQDHRHHGYNGLHGVVGLGIGMGCGHEKSLCEMV